ncbi:MAG: TolC family protein, partial [Phycisphaerae bacterium]|nr:TolC family protein [Phycisphaerae bacterium]
VLSGNLKSGLTSVFSGAVSQPLMRGFGRKIALENLTQAERETVYQLRQFNRFGKEFTVEIVSKYYRILQSVGDINHARKNIETLSDVYERMKKLESAGRLPRFELDQAAQDILKARETSIQSQSQYRQKLDAFKMDLSLPATAEFRLDESELASLMARGMTRPDFTLSQAMEAAQSHRLDLANEADRVDDAQRKIEVIADSLRAELNLIARGELVTPGDRNVNGFAGVGVDLPLDRNAERHNYRIALIELERQKRAFEEMTDAVGLQVRQGWRELNEAIERDQIQAEALTLAKNRFKNTWGLLQFSRASTRDVLDAQGDLFDAQIMATEARADYMIALLHFYRDTGIISVNAVEIGSQLCEL